MRREWMEGQKWEVWRHNMQEDYKEKMMHIAHGLEDLVFFLLNLHEEILCFYEKLMLH